MRITIESVTDDAYYHKSVVESHSEVIDDVMMDIKQALLGYGFTKETLDDYFTDS